MAHKVGDIIVKGSRYGVITKEARPIEYTRTRFGPLIMNLFEVEWLNGKSKGKREDIGAGDFYSAADKMERAQKSYERARLGYSKAIIEASKVTP